METEEEEEVAICIAELRTPNGTSEDFRVITDTIQAAVREVAHISFYRILLGTLLFREKEKGMLLLRSCYSCNSKD